MRRNKLFFTCLITFLFFLFISSNVYAQYFYKDIWNTQQLNKEFGILRNEEIKVVVVKSFEDDGSSSEGFFCEKRFDKNFTKAEMVSRSEMTGQSLLTSFYNEKGLLVKTIDSSATAISHTEYEYDNGRKITTVKTFTKADDDSGSINEIHQYIYNAAGRLEKMIKRKASSAISTIIFTTDDKGNLLDEQDTSPQAEVKKYLYYYDDKNRLTDVVHYNERAKRLLPDYMYEYNQQGQISQLISTTEGASNYFTWKYTYNEKKLRETESCYSKDKKLLGSVAYQYK